MASEDMAAQQELLKNLPNALTSFIKTVSPASLSQLKRWKPHLHFSVDIFSFYGLFATSKRRMIFLMTLFILGLFYVSFTLEYVLAYREAVYFQKDLQLNESDVYLKGELAAYEKYKSNNFSVDCKTLRKEKKTEDDFIYVGVISSEKTINTLGKAVYNTWGKEADKLNFYVGNAPLTVCECDQCKNMPIVKLDVVSDQVYPPQAKSFRMLERMCHDHLDNYKWFIRADDDGYFKFSNLRRMLHTLDENIPYILGLPNPGYIHGYLYLKVWRNAYCDGSAVIYSRAALKALCPHLRRCSENCLTHHEDVEAGRCVFNHLGQQCATSTGELSMEEIFFHKPSKTTIKFNGDPDKAAFVKKAVHIHKVVEPAVMHNLHAYYLRAQESMQEYCQLKIMKQNDRKPMS